MPLSKTGLQWQCKKLFLEVVAKKEEKEGKGCKRITAAAEKRGFRWKWTVQ